jgi:23S rRNA (pseudouridine1915-N3)-methyltransferase
LKLTVLAVGKPGKLVADAIREYEDRAARYWALDVHEVKAVKGKAEDEQRVRSAESERLLARVPPGVELFALTRVGGDAWSSTRLARHLGELTTLAHPGAAFIIGGAFGLSDDALRNADERMRLSAFTLPHDVARLILTEQLYRAGTILRGEPYHKGSG